MELVKVKYSASEHPILEGCCTVFRKIHVFGEFDLIAFKIAQ